MQHYDSIYQALIIISENKSEKSDVRHEASCLAQKMTVFENAFMAVFWHSILSRFGSVSNRPVNEGLKSTFSGEWLHFGYLVKHIV